MSENPAMEPSRTVLVDRVRAVMEGVARTKSQYSGNLKPRLNTFPIPFFGNILTAKVLTIGVNPSSGEFIDRNWPVEMDGQSLTERLLSYFQPPSNPHPWFSRWKQALALLDIDYARGEAAHLDLSPRATISMGSAPDTGLFLRMVVSDLPWFLEFLRECPHARLLMAAGTVTRQWYMNEFLGRHGRQHQFEIQPPPQPFERCKIYEWRSPGKCLPLFFSSVSPSSWGKSHVLVENVRAHQSRLRALLE